MRSSIDKRITTALSAEYEYGRTSLLDELEIQLIKYFNGELKCFDLPLRLVGSDFQKSVWAELVKIPYGETESYRKLSKKLQNEKAVRAVAAANGANALALVVPCHRVIGSDGSLTGYAGGLELKRKLLSLEGASQQYAIDFK